MTNMNTAAGTSVFDESAQSVFDQAALSPLELEELDLERIRRVLLLLDPRRRPGRARLEPRPRLSAVSLS